MAGEPSSAENGNNEKILVMNDQVSGKDNDPFKALAEKKAETEKLWRKKIYLDQKISSYEEMVQAATSDMELDALNATLEKHLLEYQETEKLWHDSQADVEAMMKALAQTMHYDKKILCSNIRWLLERKPDLKLGQIEREAKGCQPGYLSRVESGKLADPSLEFVVTAAENLGVSLDVLLHEDLSRLTPTENYLLDFLKKLEKDTLSDKLDWDMQSAQKLNYLEFEELGKTNFLFDYEPEGVQIYTDVVFGRPELIFESMAYGWNTVINGNCYELQMNQQTYLYLMNIRKTITDKNETDMNPVIEVWMFQEKKGCDFLCSTTNRDVLRDAINNLYSLVEKTASHPKVRLDVRNVIDAFMKNR